jgi:hypothetical protein
MAALHCEFWRRHPGLVWSNAEADDAVRIRAALLRPQFDRLLDIALEFGLDRVEKEWFTLSAQSSSETARARNSVERILANIQKGFCRAASRN